MQVKNGWVIYREKDIVRNQSFINKLQSSFYRRGMQLDVMIYEELVFRLSDLKNLFMEVSQQSPAFVINRSVSPWINEVMELAQIRCFNSAYVARISNDKRLTHAVLSSIGVPMLESRAINSRMFAEHKASHADRSPFILKDPLGRGGTGVELIDPGKEPFSAVRHLPEDLLYQPAGGKKGKDLRIYIVGNRIVGAVLRESASDFRANISTGGNASFYELNDSEKKLISGITSAIKLDFAGLDFLISEDGSLLFNEMEDAVGCRSLYMNSTIDMAEVFADYVRKEMGG